MLYRQRMKSMLGRLLRSLTLCSVAGLWASDKPSNANLPVPPPKGAIVLFDGGNLSNWQVVNGKPAYWKIVDGAMEVDKDCKGHVDCDHVSKQSFGSGHLHVEFWLPLMAGYTGQGRANSGVYIQGRYELQVLDSYQNRTYADGSAAAMYGQYPPLVNASRKPGMWQSYDIIFTAPRFKADGTLETPAIATVMHNGVLVHNATPFYGPTQHKRIDPYSPKLTKGPVFLQDHGNPVRFRNIWVRELKAEDAQ